MIVLSLGAGVQSTTLALLAAEGRIPVPDVAVFADTGWEPAAVYEHLDRLTAAVPFPVERVTEGNLRDDVLSPSGRFAALPLYLVGPDGSPGMARRQCSAEYKIRPIRRRCRELIGYPGRARIPADVQVVQQIGFSRDEIGRVRDSDVRWIRHAYPLLDLDGAADGRRGWTRADCVRYLTAAGWPTVPKSACVGCPYRSNRSWRSLTDDEWADAVAFDAALRTDAVRGRLRLHGTPYLNAARVPLDQVDVGRVTSHEWRDRQVDVFDAIADAEMEIGCSPWACPSDGPNA